MAVDITGANVLYAGGGNGSDFNGIVAISRDINKPTIESRGGGGFGSDHNLPENGKNGTGGGGGGQGNDGQFKFGNGGSGIVIIRYKYTTTTTAQVQQTGFLNYTNANGWLSSQVSGNTIPLTLSDLTGTMLKNRISDFSFIPSTLADLSGSISKNRISDFPFIPTALNQISGQIPVSTISNFPFIPDAYIKG